MRDKQLKIVLFLLSLPSGSILLLKAYGVSQMYHSLYYLFLPSVLLFFLALVLAYRKSKEVYHLAIIGALGGLIGTFGYDLARVPFMLMGSRIFVPINMYGIWLSDASNASAFTDSLGWVYHFSNGITFGILYALFMKGKSFWWAIGYALLLETIFVVSPFGELFGLASKPLSLAAAYLGHVAYGYPLGKMVQNYDATLKSLRYFKKGLVTGTGLIALATLVLCLFFYRNKEVITEITFNDKSISPSIIRLEYGGQITLNNQMTSPEKQSILIGDAETELLPNERKSVDITAPGIFQVKVKNNQKLKSIFVLSEPVEQFNQAN